MRTDAILGKIIALTKQIMLREPSDGSGFIHQFMAGNGKPSLSRFSGIGMEWWYTISALELCDDIASMALRHDPTLRGGDQKAFSLALRDTLTKNAINGKLFNGALFYKARALFDMRRLRKEREFAVCLWDVIRASLQKMITGWLILYPLTRISIPHSFDLGYGGVLLVHADDTVAWERFTTKYPEVKFWDPHSGSFNGERMFPPSDSHVTWLVCEIEGTQDGARFAAGERMQTFLAVLASHVCSLNLGFLEQRAEIPNSCSVQFPLDSAQVACGMSRAPIGTLLHSFPGKLDLSADILNEVRVWYGAYSSADEDFFHRATKGAHFINYGMTASGIVQFIHFYISLDALFGDFNRVEKGIKLGLSKMTHSDTKWDEKVDKLYEMRNELIHGGSSRIDECRGFGHYKRRFRSDPLYDVRNAAMAGLRDYFRL